MKNEIPTFEIVIDENSGVEAIKLTDKPIIPFISFSVQEEKTKENENK